MNLTLMDAELMDVMSKMARAEFGVGDDWQIRQVRPLDDGRHVVVVGGVYPDKRGDDWGSPVPGSVRRGDFPTHLIDYYRKAVA